MLLFQNKETTLRTIIIIIIIINITILNSHSIIVVMGASSSSSSSSSSLSLSSPSLSHYDTDNNDMNTIGTNTTKNMMKKSSLSSLSSLPSLSSLSSLSLFNKKKIAPIDLVNTTSDKPVSANAPNAHNNDDKTSKKKVVDIKLQDPTGCQSINNAKTITKENLSIIDSSYLADWSVNYTNIDDMKGYEVYEANTSMIGMIISTEKRIEENGIIIYVNVMLKDGRVLKLSSLQTLVFLNKL